MIKSHIFICFFSIVFLSGCTNTGVETDRRADLYQTASFNTPTQSKPLELEYYVRELVADMALNIRAVDSLGTIGVTNFVLAGSKYQSTNRLGYLLAENFMMELHLLGFDTVDFKVTDFIRVTPNGDFAMSRDYLELETPTPIKYVLVGKLTNHKNGYIVHARIVDIKSKKVLALGESYIPNKLVNMLVMKSSSQSQFSNYKAA